MSAITILPTHQPEASFEAAQGKLSAQGRTAGEALDALTALLETPTTHVVIVQSQRPDRFFGAAEQARLKTLMQRFQTAQAGEASLSDAEREELEALVNAELEAAAARAQELADALR